MLWLAVVLSAACQRPSAVQRAQAFVRMHRENEAAALLRERVRSEPKDLQARRLLVRVLGFVGDLAAARAEATELASRLPADDPTAYLELGHALELAHRYDEALAAYDEAGVRAPLSPAGPREGGMRSARWGEAQWAAPRLEEAIRRGAGDPETWHALGLVRLHLNDVDGAEQAYRNGVATDPRSGENWLGLATVAVARGDAGGALDAYDQVVARAPRSGAAHLGRAWALAKLGRKQDASRALDRAQELGASAANVARQRAALDQ